MLSAVGEPRSGSPAESKHPYDLVRIVGEHGAFAVAMRLPLKRTERTRGQGCFDRASRFAALSPLLRSA
jgi:hypothetical protein